MDEEEHVREVYARFGLAIYHAQLLEVGVVNALVVLDLIPGQRHLVKSKDEWGALVDDFMDSRFELTMGKLFKGLRITTSVPPDLDALLTSALQRRNWLAHGFFWDRAEHFMTSNGRDSMLEELQECSALFTNADAQLEELVRPVRISHGLTDAMVSEAYSTMIRELRRDGKPSLERP